MVPYIRKSFAKHFKDGIKYCYTDSIYDLNTIPKELSFDDIVARLRKLNCKKEKTMMNSIAAMYQFRGGISETDVKKIILKMSMQKIISISETGAITWK